MAPVTVHEPTSAEDLVYFTKRIIDRGSVKAWVYRGDCPKCKKAKMGKPRGKNGKVKIRAKEYICPVCEYTLPKEDHEKTLSVEIMYTCPYCTHEGECAVPYVRVRVSRFDEKKKKRVSMDAVRFQCQNCGENIDITKKMK